MRLRRGLVSSLLFVVFVCCARAEDGRDRAATNTAPPQARRAVLTGKERLGPKWTDEQRIDNCKVPIDRRGTKSRPGGCTGSPSS